MASKAVSSSISYHEFSTNVILSLLSLDNIKETKTESMTQLKKDLEEIRHSITTDLQAFQELVDRHIPQIEATSNPELESLKFRAIVQTFEHGRIESSLFNELVTKNLIENNEFISPETFNMIPQREGDQQEEDYDDKTFYRVRTICYDTFVTKLQLLNRYTHELDTALTHLEKSHIDENARPYLTTLFKALDMTQEGSPILEKFQDVFNKYSGIKNGNFAPYVKKRDEVKARLSHLKNHTLQRGVDIIGRCNSRFLPLTLSAAIAKACRYGSTSPKELDAFSSNESYIEELTALSSIDSTPQADSRSIPEEPAAATQGSGSKKKSK